MILTGLLIYVPSTSRAGIAVLLCMVAIANLNYFHPHKNKVLFWLTQLSFLTTGAKYVMALLLTARLENKEDRKLIGTIMIYLDMTFMISSAIAIPFAVIVLKTNFDRQKNK